MARYDYIGDSCDSSIGNGNDARYVEGLRQTLPNNETGFVADNRCPRRIGLIAEEAPQEVLSADGKGVDLYKMTSLAWAGIKAQQKQIDALRMDVDELKNKIREMGGLSAGGGSALGGSFASVLDTLRGFGAIFENGVARFQQVIVGSLAVEKNSDSGQSAVGEGTIAAGQTEYQINSGQIKADSKVFVTWRGDYGSRWWIDQQADGSATVKIAAPLANDVRFDWMVIGVETAKSDSSSPQMRGGTEGGVLNENNTTPPPAPSSTEEGRIEVAPSAQEQPPAVAPISAPESLADTSVETAPPVPTTTSEVEASVSEPVVSTSPEAETQSGGQPVEDEVSAVPASTE